MYEAGREVLRANSGARRGPAVAAVATACRLTEESLFSKERRLEPQITVGLLTDVRGFPLQVHAFDSNTADTKAILTYEPTDLPPQTRLHRGPPHHRDGRLSCQPLARKTGWSIKKLVTTLRHHRSIAVQTGDHLLHAGTPLDADARAAINAVKNAASGH
jgi:hypothetical protein